MAGRKRANFITILLLFGSLLGLNCNAWTALPVKQLGLPKIGSAPKMTAPAMPTPSMASPLVMIPTHTAQPDQKNAAESPALEPAGCLSVEAQAALNSPKKMLSYADQLLKLDRQLNERVLPPDWGNPAQVAGAVSIDVSDVKNVYLVQRMLNALFVAGFVPWLSSTSHQGLHILAIPLLDPAVGSNGSASPWRPYLEAYWQDAHSIPAADASVIQTLKLPPCAWMIADGFAPALDYASWVAGDTGWPDYARAAAAYLADTTQQAMEVAHRIGWLGDAGDEGANTMCGPLSWSILKDAGALPQDYGGWSVGPQAFWLADPHSNRRPWVLFPSESYHLYSIGDPLGRFDFQHFPLYPGDFLYTFSQKDGFDHMLVVTEVDADGNVYTVTNLTQVSPLHSTTIERVLLLNLADPNVGIARNQWASDRVNGRTGHAGFDVFRWAWAEKDISGQPAAYTVQPGDTLASIALRWKTPAEHIAGYNGIVSGAVLRVGQALSIPPNPLLVR